MGDGGIVRENKGLEPMGVVVLLFGQVNDDILNLVALQLAEVVSLVQFRNALLFFHYIIILTVCKISSAPESASTSSASALFLSTARSPECLISRADLHTISTYDISDCVMRLVTSYLSTTSLTVLPMTSTPLLFLYSAPMAIRHKMSLKAY